MDELVSKIKTEIQQARCEVSDAMPDPEHVPDASIEARTYWYGLGRVEALNDALVLLVEHGLITPAQANWVW